MKLTEMRIDYLLRQRYPAASDDLQRALFNYTGEGTLTEQDDELVERLIDQFDLNMGDVTPGAGRNEKRATLEETRVWLIGICALRDFLEKSRPREIVRLYDEAVQPDREKRRLELIEADKDDFFSEPASSEGTESWLAVATWTVEEAVALTLGKNPSVVNPKTLGGPAGGSPFRKEFRRRIDVIKRATSAGEMAEPLRPEAFVTWARGQLEFDLTDSPLQGKTAKVDPAPEPRLHGSTENTLRKLVLGMAVKHYGLSLIPDQNLGSEAWQRIAADLASVGLSVHSDTVNTQFNVSLEKARSRVGDSLNGKKFKRDCVDFRREVTLAFH